MPGPDPRGICHYPAVVPEVLGHLACCFPGGVPNALCGLQILQHAEHAVLRPGLGATELWKSRIDLANRTVRPELGHFQGLKLTVCWRSSISFLEPSSWTRQSCVYSGLALSGVSSSAWRSPSSLFPSSITLWLSKVVVKNLLASCSYWIT